MKKLVIKSLEVAIIIAAMVSLDSKKMQDVEVQSFASSILNAK